ncbi:class IIb bacteriocin, lactobin A/cerein 7B family [Rudanella paleaurantiibacter]|uniref:Class IIb bacteriocin, lactobin A/cerein 7B family n=1 Tax=Rudanella paleaurantiibacter TaxID=2614655 RepID=A0A7J5TRW3_9BACT|nr:class IIb bacteriocin, lactobin A/cerein 7B family [Rudanella paleaurantiibacter]KAB7725717.1 class IIb bacteriocin, lactobin A/cerein 7B family [Rudanella paleaurantiibacter]
MNVAENQDLYYKLISQSWKDESFKKSLLSSPIPTIESFIGRSISLESGKQRIVVEDQSNSSTVYLNIPEKPDFIELELTDEQLEMVAGGSTPLCVVGGVFLVGVVIGYCGASGSGDSGGNTTINNNTTVIINK